MQIKMTSFNRAGIFLPLIIVVVLVAIVIGYIAFTLNNVGKPCGGLAANLSKYQCKPGLLCKTVGSYPDAGGTCQQIWPLSLIIGKVSQ